MINIVLYKHSKDFYQLDYSNFDNVEKVIFITPSPFHADTLRSKLSRQAKIQNFDVITMSKYLKDELVSLVDSEVLEKFKGKAELILYLSTAWKAISSELNVGLFKKAFNLLTDLRSFSLSDQVIDAALEDFDSEISHSVMAFQKVIEHENIIDEHLANYLLSERLRKGDLPLDYDLNKTYVFWGFDFLSAVQVDLLKAIGIRNQVIVPIVKDVYEKSQSTDWVKWLTDQESNFVELTQSEIKFNAKVLEFPTNYLSRVLSKELVENPNCDIYLATKTLSANSIQEVSLLNHHYKVSTNFFTDAVTNLFEQLKILLEENNLCLETNYLMKWPDGLAKQYLEQQDFRNLKAVLLFKKSLANWFELSTHNNTFTLFDLYIFKEVIMLDLPRVSLMPYGKEHNGKIAGIKELAAFNSETNNILCVTSDYGPIKSSGQNYTEKVEKYLTSIGPIRRAEFEFEVLKHRIFELLELRSTTVFIEKGLIEHDVGWSNILSEFKESVIDASMQAVSIVKKDFIENVKSQKFSVSATRLQNYLDCPRKYYLNYLGKLNPSIEVPGKLDILKLGELEHAVIESYLNAFNEFRSDDFIATIKKCLEELTSKYNINLKQKALDTHLIEIRSLCGPIIKNLLELNKSFGLNYSFEHGILINQEINYTGSIDLYAFNQKIAFILDFKRGGASIPSQKGLVSFEKIQLWFYLKRLQQLGVLQLDKEIVFGYINLSRPEESLVLCTQEISRSLLKQTQMPIFKKVAVLKQDIQEILTSYEELEIATINAINNETTFDPMPARPKVCDYCAIKNICPRELINE